MSWRISSYFSSMDTGDLPSYRRACSPGSFAAGLKPAGYVPTRPTLEPPQQFLLPRPERGQRVVRRARPRSRADRSRPARAAMSRSIRSFRIAFTQSAGAGRRHRRRRRPLEQRRAPRRSAARAAAPAESPAARRPDSRPASAPRPTPGPPGPRRPAAPTAARPSTGRCTSVHSRPLLGRPQPRRRPAPRSPALRGCLPAAAFRISSRITPSVTRALCASRSAN